MKRYLMGCAALTLLAGCASVADLRKNKPDAEFSSQHTVSDVVACVSSGWSEKRVQVNVVPITGGQSVQLASSGGPPVAILDVVAGTAGSTAQFFSQAGSGSWFANRAKACQ